MSLPKLIYAILLFWLPISAFSFSFTSLFQTADQQGSRLLRAGKASEAAQVFKNREWQATACYRAGNYRKAWEYFSKQKTSDGQYNAGNAAAYLGRYQDAIHAYDKALAFNPNNKDAKFNREIVKKLMEQEKKNQSNKSCQKNSSAAKSKNEKQNAENKSDQNKQQTTKQNQADNNVSQDKKDDKKDDEQGDATERADLSRLAGKSHGTSQQNKEQQKGQDNIAAQTGNQSQAQEDQKQLLRRLPDDPGGLLRQKFIREYIRRHTDADS